MLLCASMRSIQRANRLAQEAKYRRLNFRYHVIPIVRKGLEEAQKLFREHGVVQIPPSITSELRHELEDTKETIWTDSITVRFGSRGLGIEPVVNLANQRAQLDENCGSLLISHSIAGHVMVMIAPPCSQVASSQKGNYLVEYWPDPCSLTVPKFHALLDLALKVSIFCSATTYPNTKGERLMASLQAKDSVLSNGGSRPWVWLMYIYNLVKGVARLYGMGAPK